MVAEDYEHGHTHQSHYQHEVDQALYHHEETNQAIAIDSNWVFTLRKIQCVRFHSIRLQNASILGAYFHFFHLLELDTCLYFDFALFAKNSIHDAVSK